MTIKVITIFETPDGKRFATRELAKAYVGTMTLRTKLATIIEAETAPLLTPREAAKVAKKIAEQWEDLSSHE